MDQDLQMDQDLVMDQEGMSALKLIDDTKNLDLLNHNESIYFASIKSALSDTPIHCKGCGSHVVAKDFLSHWSRHGDAFGPMDQDALRILNLIDNATADEGALESRRKFVREMQICISKRQVKCCHCGSLNLALDFSAHWKCHQDDLEKLRHRKISLADEQPASGAAGDEVLPDAEDEVLPDAGDEEQPDAGDEEQPDAGVGVLPDAVLAVQPDAGFAVLPDAGAGYLPDAGAVYLPVAGAGLPVAGQLHGEDLALEEFLQDVEAEREHLNGEAAGAGHLPVAEVAVAEQLHVAVQLVGEELALEEIHQDFEADGEHLNGEAAADGLHQNDWQQMFDELAAGENADVPLLQLVNPAAVVVNPAAVGVNPAAVGVNPDAVGVNPADAVGVNPAAVGVNPAAVGNNPAAGVNPAAVGNNPAAVGGFAGGHHITGYQCLVCLNVGLDVWFTSAELLTIHKKTQHMEQLAADTFRCAYCSYMGTARAVSAHFLNRYQPNPALLFRCAVGNCARAFWSQMALDGHMNGL